jgi:flagellar hook-basal body complex protein FliE
MTLPNLTSTASAALQAYRSMSSVGSASAPQTGAAGAGFGAALQSALEGVASQGHAAEGLAMKAVAGEGNILDVVSAVSKAELSLQTTIAVRDRVVQAYQDIMRMPI